MDMSTWVIISWVFVAILTAINIFVFLKLKKAASQMMQMAFPGAKNMNEAVLGMEKMMKSMKRGQGNPFAGGQQSPQLRAAMQMLEKQRRGR